MATADDVINQFKANCEKAIEAFTKELSRIRAGKASPALLESIRVNYYGQTSPLQQVGNVSTPDARTLMIAPWDASVLPEIEKAINAANLGLNPQNDGKVIRISIPALTEERRKELVKVVNKVAEEARVGVRQHRKTANEGLKNLEKDKALSEDDSKKKQEVVQKLTDEKIKQIDQLLAKKTDEIMTV